MAYCCVSRGQLFLTGFILLIEPSYCVPGAIKCNKQYLIIVSSLTQDNYHQSSDVLLSILECDKVHRILAKGNKERWFCGSFRNQYIIWNSTNSLDHLTKSGGHSISRCIGEIIPKHQRHFKALKERNEVSRNRRISNMNIFHTVVHSVAEAISIDLLSRKIRKVSGTYSSESNQVGYPVEENIEGESHESFDFSGDILIFSLQTRELLWVITGELLMSYWGITR